jgi:hypothetical protein
MEAEIPRAGFQRLFHFFAFEGIDHIVWTLTQADMNVKR